MQIVIPVRTLISGKTRLAAALDPQARQALIGRMFRHVLRCALSAGPTTVVSRDPSLLALAQQMGARAVVEAGEGLNPALEQVARTMPHDQPLLALSADLPLLRDDDLAALLRALGQAAIVAAPDRSGSGTNALLLARPQSIAYAFGNDSLKAHRSASSAARLPFATVAREGLASDIDLPGDLALLGASALSAA